MRNFVNDFNLKVKYDNDNGFCKKIFICTMNGNDSNKISLIQPSFFAKIYFIGLYMPSIKQKTLP